MARPDPTHTSPSASTEPSLAPGARTSAGARVVPEPPSPPRPRRRRSWWRLAALAVPALAIVALGFVVGVYTYIIGTATFRADPRAAHRPRPQDRLFAWPLRLTDRVNVLIMGVDITLDNRRRVLNVARADTLLLASFDPHARRIVALSIPRDTRAEIPGHGTTKINAAYAYGGPALTIRTVERLLAVKVHYYVKMGPESFAQFIDALGGLEVDVEKDMKYTDSWAGYTIDLKRGRQRLTGAQVTGYIRFRHDELGDIGRVQRQRKVMQTMIQELKKPATLLAGPALLQAFLANTQTDLRPADLLALGLFAVRLPDGGLQELTLPGRFEPSYWGPDFGKIRPMVAELFYGLDPRTLAATRVDVVDGTGIPARGAEVAARLREVGFRDVRVRSGVVTVEATTVVARPAHLAAARLAAAAIGRAALRQHRAADGAAIVILLARDVPGTTQARPPRRNGSQ